VLNYDASVGGRENRLTTTSDFITNLNTTVTTDMSNTEDVDLSLLMTNLAQQQLAYETVLKATSMINGLSLLNYM
jgi:flagellar hook-associated protein 3 FlgL